MKPLPALALLLLGGSAGFLLGRAERDGEQRAVSERQSAGRRAQVELVREQERLDEDRRRLAAENTELRRKVEQLEGPAGERGAEAAPQPGERLPDGRIVGGAKWNDTFVRLSTGFLDSMIEGFVRDAKLSPEQERRLREEVRTGAQRIMQVTAEFTNGDLDGDATYAKLETLSEELRGNVRQLLDDEQVATFHRFQTTIRAIMHQQIVHNEMATLKSALDLDAEQEKRVLAVVEERYRRVGEGISMPIPNVYFKPLRREQDGPIYEETARAIRGLLSPDQRSTFDRWEAKAPEAPFQYRSQLDAR